MSQRQTKSHIARDCPETARIICETCGVRSTCLNSTGRTRRREGEGEGEGVQIPLGIFLMSVYLTVYAML